MKITGSKSNGRHTTQPIVVVPELPQRRTGSTPGERSSSLVIMGILMAICLLGGWFLYIIATYNP